MKTTTPVAVTTTKATLSSTTTTTTTTTPPLPSSRVIIIVIPIVTVLAIIAGVCGIVCLCRRRQPVGPEPGPVVFNAERDFLSLREPLRQQQIDQFSSSSSSAPSSPTPFIADLPVADQDNAPRPVLIPPQPEQPRPPRKQYDLRPRPTSRPANWNPGDYYDDANL